jgi:hypothetical protein
LAKLKKKKTVRADSLVSQKSVDAIVPRAEHFENAEPVLREAKEWTPPKRVVNTAISTVR